MIKEKIPEWHAEMCHPENKYRIDIVKDEIFTLEGLQAGLPYGGSSGKWGNSGKMWTEQHGTPTGADITYYAGYDNIFYRLKIELPVEKMKDLVKRNYAFKEIKEKKVKEYVYEGDSDLSYIQDTDASYKSYDAFTSLIFGFAPKGMVVVWANYGLTVIEIGRYQAEIITDDEELQDAKNKYLKIWRFSSKRFDDLAKDFFVPDANCELWDAYRIRYNWRPVFISENPQFKIFEVNTEYYNAEKEQMLRPWLLENKGKDRALPSVMQFFWETGKNEKFVGRIFFNQKELFERFKNISGENEMQVKIAEDNRSIEVFLNNQILKVDSVRIYPNDYKVYNESYK